MGIGVELWNFIKFYAISKILMIHWSLVFLKLHKKYKKDFVENIDFSANGQPN